MAYTTFTPKAANTVQAQTISAITDRARGDVTPHYKLADGTLIAVDRCKVFPPGYQPIIPGDYMVIAQGNGAPTVWKASVFTSQYS